MHNRCKYDGIIQCINNNIINTQLYFYSYFDLDSTSCLHFRAIPIIFSKVKKSIVYSDD